METQVQLETKSGNAAIWRRINVLSCTSRTASAKRRRLQHMVSLGLTAELQYSIAFRHFSTDLVDS